MSTPAPDPTKPTDNPFAEMVRNPAARTYLLIGAGGLLVMAFVYLLFVPGGWIAAAVVLMFGLTGLTLRWAAGPPAVVAAVCYFSFFPGGLPIQLQPGNQIMSRQKEPNLLVVDLMLTVSALAHLMGTYRYFAVLRSGMPFDAPAEFVKPGAKPTVRPAVPVREGELLFLFARVGVAVLSGQLLWLAATKLKVDFRKGFPLRPFENFAEEGGNSWRLSDPGALYNGPSRFLIVAAGVLVVSFAVWLVIWYWRLSVMSREEAKAACLDQQWTTNRRDLNRPEKWRGWAKQKAASVLPKPGCVAWLLAGLITVGIPCLLSCAGFIYIRSQR